MGRDPAEKSTEKRTERRINTRFINALEKYDFRNEQRLLTLIKWILYVILMFMELLVLLQHVEQFISSGDWVTFVAFLITASTLTASETLKMVVYADLPNKRVFYFLEALSACGFMAFTVGSYSLIIYILVLTQFYLNAENVKSASWIFVTSILLFMLSYGIQLWLRMEGDIYLIEIFRESLGAVVALSFHFVAFQVVFTFYRQYLKLNRTLDELDENKRALEKAYEAVAEVTALEERQRIAKEIHDTAGHSITTVIMQTEAAKRIVESSPEEAKAKIIAANLQAKHALEELRNSVHLLSGMSEGHTLRSALEGVIHESTDGTGIRIRSEIEDLTVSQAKYRFICNTLKEGISNGLRHGGATAFWFELKTEGGKIRFLLSDNGKGLGGKELRTGFGLRTMKDRARALGGEVSFVSEPEEGFEIRMTLPV